MTIYSCNKSLQDGRKLRACHEEVADLSATSRGSWRQVGNKSNRVVSLHCNVNWP